MTLVYFQGNDCRVGIKDGRLFITSMTKCCHGKTVDQVTIWLPVELREKLQDIRNYDDLQEDARINLN
jgi:hypothetical protein